MDIKIRQALVSDIKDLLEISKESFPIPWSERSMVFEITNPLSICLVAEVDGETVGYIFTSYVEDTAQINSIAVRKPYRRRGIGSRLLQEATRLLRKRGCKEIFLEVRESNRPALSLYEKAGFVRASIRKNYYTEPRENAIVMKRDLSL